MSKSNFSEKKKIQDESTPRSVAHRPKSLSKTQYFVERGGLCATDHGVGKEMPHASFNKFTSSNILKDLKIKHPKVVPFFEEKTEQRNHRIWQVDPLAVPINSKVIFEQKLDYIHNNPLNE